MSPFFDKKLDLYIVYANVIVFKANYANFADELKVPLTTTLMFSCHHRYSISFKSGIQYINQKKHGQNKRCI